MESKIEYEELFNRVSSCVAVYEATGNGNDFIFKDFNTAAEKVDKIKRKDVIGRSVLDVFPAVKEFGLFDVFKRVYKTGKSETHPISIYKDSRISGWRENFIYKLANGNIVTVYNDLTEKKQAEEELTLANERLSLAQNSAGAGVWDWDMNAEKLNWSAELYNLFGLDPKKDTASFDTWRRVLHPDDRQRAEERLNESIKKHKPLFNEYRIIKPSGEVLWINTRGNTIYDEYGKAARMLGICIDITERKKTEEVLYESEEKYRTLFDTCEDGIIIAEIETQKFKYANPAICQMFGYTEKELTTMDISAIHPKEDLQRVLTVFKDQIRGINSLAKDITCLRKDGTIFYADINATNIVIDGRKYGVGFCHDTTERKQVEDLLQIEHERLSNILEGTNVGTWEWNVQTREIVYNERWANIIGYTLDEISPISIKTWERFCNPEDLKKSNEQLNKVFAREIDYYDIECRMKHKDGNWIWVQDIGKVISWTPGAKPLLMSGIQTDITDRKQMEESLRASEEKFAKAFHSSPQGLTIATLDDNKIIEVNNTYTDIFGYSREEAIGHTSIKMGSWVNPDYRAEIVNILKEKGFVHNKEVEVRTKSGDMITLLLSAELIDMGGKACMLSTFYNITDRKKAEKLLLESEEKYRNLVEKVNEAILIIQDGNFVFANRKAHELMSTLGTNFIGKSFIDFVWPEDREMVAANFRKRISGEEFDETYDFRIIGTQDEPVWVYTSVALVQYKDRPATLIMVTNINERKKAEQEILHLSFHDQLTGLYNRRFFEEELKRLDTKRQLPLSFIMGDLNGLKLINDVFGHTQGDEVLKKTAEILKRVCRSDDILARWGGDEFVILLPKTSIADSEDIVQRIKKECKKTAKQKIPMSLSLGAAQKETVVQNIQAVIIDAESNMYRNKLAQKESISSSIIFALDQALYEKSNETKEHTDRIREITIKLGKSAKLSTSQLDEISLLASLHDIGKVAIPEAILLKEGKLTKQEWEVIKRHPEIGFNIASSSPQIAHIAKPILSCHENWDGSGYPLGLAGELIPVISRIILIADAYDVMTTGRIYKEPMSKDDAIKELKRCAGSQFDPVLVDKFIEILSE